MERVIEKARDVSAGGAVHTLLAMVERRTVGEKPGRSGRTRDVMSEILLKGGEKDAPTALRAYVRTFLDGCVLTNLDDLPTGFRNANVYQNNGGMHALDHQAFFNKHQSDRGVYV